MTDAGSDALAPGVVLGNYRVERLLGRGGMGAVYLAFDAKLHRQVAIKVVASPPGDETSRARLLREARNAAALNHPNICTIHEVGAAGGVAFIAMEWVSGRSLRDRLDEGALPLAEAIQYGIQASEGLGYAHDQGVVHRDFKAANVIVTAAGCLKIVDFGLARRDDPSLTGSTTEVSLVRPGTVAGTPYAMAPEQVRAGEIDARTDLWALGVLLHEMLSGTRPFAAATTPELFSSILRDKPASLPGAVPAELRTVVARCLEKIPEDRWAHARDVHEALEALAALPAMRTETTAPPSVSKPRPDRRRWLARVASFAAAIALLVTLNLARVRGWLAGDPHQTATVKLAVLPLENLTGNPDLEYLSDGLTDELTSALSRLHSSRLSVIPRSLSMQYKQSTKSPDQIGRELGATAALKASVTRTGDRVRIDATLVQTSDARQLWHDTYERGTGDLFAMEHDLSGAVIAVLRIPEDSEEPNSRAKARPVAAEAYDLYLRGLSHASRNNEKDIDQAIQLFERSTALDPTFVPAQAYLALTYGNKAAIFRPDDPQWEEKGFAAVQKALALDPDAPEAHYAQAMMLWRPSHGFPNREVLQELRKALTAQPNFDEALHQHAVILYHVGHLEASLDELRRTLEINPANTLARFRFGPIYVNQQKFEAALAALAKVPQAAFPAQWSYQKAWALISLGRLDEAGRLIDAALTDNPVDQGGVLHAARAMLRAKRGDRRNAKADIAEAIRVGKTFIHFHHTAYSIGAVYATLGELDDAQEWIETAANSGFPNFTYFEADVHLAPLRATPRFRTFLSKLQLEWEHIPGEPD